MSTQKKTMKRRRLELAKETSISRLGVRIPSLYWDSRSGKKATIFHLPNDIIKIIFELVVTPRYLALVGLDSPTRHLYILSSVCLYFYNIANSIMAVRSRASLPGILPHIADRDANMAYIIFLTYRGNLAIKDTNSELRSIETFEPTRAGIYDKFGLTDGVIDTLRTNTGWADLSMIVSDAINFHGTIDKMKKRIKLVAERKVEAKKRQREKQQKHLEEEIERYDRLEAIAKVERAKREAYEKEQRRQREEYERQENIRKETECRVLVDQAEKKQIEINRRKKDFDDMLDHYGFQSREILNKSKISWASAPMNFSPLLNQTMINWLICDVTTYPTLEGSSFSENSVFKIFEEFITALRNLSQYYADNKQWELLIRIATIEGIYTKQCFPRELGNLFGDIW